MCFVQAEAKNGRAHTKRINICLVEGRRERGSHKKLLVGS